MTETIREVEDNYEEYLSDELGYAWGVWDRQSLAAIARHDELLNADAETVAATDPASLDDLERLALARAAHRASDVEAELDALRLIASEPMEHPGVHYVEIFERLASRLCDESLFDEAEMMLDRLQGQEWCEHPPNYARALVRFRSDRTQGIEPFESLLAESPDDAELRFDLAEDLAAFGAEEHVEPLLAAAEEIARRTGIDAVLVDIAVFRASRPTE